MERMREDEPWQGHQDKAWERKAKGLFPVKQGLRSSLLRRGITYVWTKEGECQNKWSIENSRGMCWTCCKALSQCIIHSTKKLRLGIGRVAVQRKERKIINGFWWMWGFQKPGRKCNKTWSGLEGKIEEELNIVNFRTDRLSPHVWYTVLNEQCWEMQILLS